MNGELTNRTGETILVYGPKRPGETFDNSLYLLPTGRKTPAGWDCDGFYVPNDRVADQALSNVRGPVAIKYRDYRSPVIETSSPGHYRCPLNEGVYRSGEIHWSIPSIAHSAIPGSYPEVPRHEGGHMSMLDRKVAMSQVWCVEGLVEEEGDHYLIDVAPCLPNPIFRVPKVFVQVTQTDKEVTCPDGSKHKLARICIKKDAKAVMMQPVSLHEVMAMSEEESRAADTSTMSLLRWPPRPPRPPGLNCDTACTLTFPQYYPLAKEGLRKARDKGLIRDKGHCKDIARDVALLTEILTAGELGPLASIVAAAIVGQCGKCACEKVF